MASVSSNAKAQTAKGIKTIPANSSFIAAFEYDENNLTLTTHFKNGSIYQHKFVTPGDWDLLQTAKSQSKHWGTAIKGNKIGVTVKREKAPNSEIKLGGR